MMTTKPEITEKRNPLDYFCAPNAATPDYVTCSDMKDFIAYGMIESFLDPEEISSEYEVTNDAIRWLRIGFLRCLEITAKVLPDVKKGDQVDFGSQGTSITLYPPGFNPAGHESEDAEDYLDFEWKFERRDNDGAVCIVLTWTSKDGDTDDVAIWVDSRCFKNKKRFEKLMIEAKEKCGLPNF